MSSFTPNIPAASDRPSASQSQIQSNFNAIADDLDKNHVAISDLTNRGKHKFVEMPVQAAKPTPLAANEVTLYSKTVSGQSEMFMVRGTNIKEIQLSAGANASVPTLGNTGVTFIPGGLLLQWGQTNINLNGNTTINFPLSFSVTRAYSITVTPFRNSSNVDTVYLVPGSFTVSSFDVRNTSSSGITAICWMAIGPA